MDGTSDRHAARLEEIARAERLAVRLVAIWDELRPAVLEYVDLCEGTESFARLDEAVEPCGGLLVTFLELIQDGVVASTLPVSPWGLEKLRRLGVAEGVAAPA